MTQNRIDKSFVAIIILFVFSAIFSWLLYFKTYHQQDTVNVHNFPKKIGDWVAEEIPISDHDYEILETRNAFTRKYLNSLGEEINLFIVYSQHNRKVSHPPEICYTGSGATFVSNVPFYIDIDSMELRIRLNKILVEMGLKQQVMCYWFKVGKSFTSNYWEQQILIALKTILVQPSSSALIRISSDVKEGDQEKATQNIINFVKISTPLISKYLP